MKIPNYDSNTKNESNQFNLHPFFGDKPIRMLLCGSSGSGKTNILMHIILSPLIYYDHIIIYSKTIDQDKYKQIEEIFKKVMKDSNIKQPFWTFTNEAVKPHDTLDKVKRKIVIFDDLICTSKKELAIIQDYYILGRHFKISPIFLTQSYYMLNKGIRINCSHFIIFRLNNKRETSSVLGDHPGVDLEMYNKATEGYDCLCINKLNKMIVKNLDENIEK